MKKILVVCRCVGGTNTIEPVTNILQKDHEIDWIEHDKPEDVKYLPDAIITSPCSRIGRDVVKPFIGKCPVIAIQNQWTAGLTDVWLNTDFKPDFVLVNDEVDRQLTLKAWPGFDESHVVITGYPAMDKYAHFDMTGAPKRVSEALGIDVSGRIPIVLFAGQWWSTGHAILETVAVLNHIGKFVHFIPRAHRDMQVRSYEEIPAWKQALSDFARGNLVVDSSACSISDLIAVATVIISMYSTVLQEAAALRKPNIAILYPDTGLRTYKAVAGDVEYPLVYLGCTALASNREGLINKISAALDNKLALKENQEKAFRLDGKNAQRAAEFIEKLL